MAIDVSATSTNFPIVEIDVNGSQRQRFFKSTNSPYCSIKSAPIIGLSTLAIVKFQVNSLLRPSETVSFREPYVLIVVEFAAVNVRL